MPHTQTYLEAATATAVVRIVLLVSFPPNPPPILFTRTTIRFEGTPSALAVNSYSKTEQQNLCRAEQGVKNQASAHCLSATIATGQLLCYGSGPIGSATETIESNTSSPVWEGTQCFSRQHQIQEQTD